MAAASSSRPPVSPVPPPPPSVAATAAAIRSTGKRRVNSNNTKKNENTAAASSSSSSTSTTKPSAAKRAKKATSSRYDSSLGLLTKKFVKTLQEADDGMLDLNTAAKLLGVQKRRIYDITNVLEGIGLIEKRSKNNISWKGAKLTSDGQMSEAQREATTLRKEIDYLSRQETMIDDYISRMQDMLRDLGAQRENSQLAYVTHDDIRQLPTFEGETLIAIKAPSGTTLEVPDPDEGMDYPNRRFQIFLKSPTTAIDVFLVSEHPNGGNRQLLPPQAHDLNDGTPVTDANNSMTGTPPGTAAAVSSAAAVAAAASTNNEEMMKLEPPNDDHDFFYEMNKNEGIVDFYK